MLYEVITIGEYLAADLSVPAIGQGALGIESRIDDAETNRNNFV